MTVLTWQNDPIYFDVEPTPVNEWINANELLQNEKTKERLFVGTHQLNLFPILVRRADFVRENTTDRILARFPYVQLSTEEQEQIKDQELTIAERLRDYFYRSDNRRILEWREILRKDLERSFVPLPFLRCFPEEVKINLAGRTFSSARGENFAITHQLTEELAYLCGIVNGDGSLTKYVLNIIDFSMDHIRQLKDIFERLFQQTGRIQLQTENSPALIITNLWVVRLFSFLTDQPIGGKKYQQLKEPLIFKDNSLRSLYWSGVMDADGSYRNNNVTLTSTSKDYVQAFISFLSSLNIQATLNERDDGTYQVYIPRKYHGIFRKRLICLHPEKNIDFKGLKEGKEISEVSAKFFHSFNEDKIINGFFDFTKMNDIQIVGLGEIIKSLRGESYTQKEFISKLGVTIQYLSQIENNKTSINFNLLENILQRYSNISIMDFLMQQEKSILYRRKKAPPIYLDLSPTEELELIARQLIYYPTTIRVQEKNNALLEKIQNHFNVEIRNNVITNGTLRHYFSTFFNFIE